MVVDKKYAFSPKYARHCRTFQKVSLLKMSVGAPQGSKLTAALFRLHVHFLPSVFTQSRHANSACVHPFGNRCCRGLLGSLFRMGPNNPQSHRRVNGRLSDVDSLINNNTTLSDIYNDPRLDRDTF